MRLQDSRQKPWIWVLCLKLWSRMAGRILGIFVYSMLLFVLSAFVLRAGFFGDIRNFITEPLRYTSNTVAGMLAAPERLVIDMNFRSWNKLEHQREVALAKKRLIVGDADYVPATIRYGDKTVKVKLRLKGDHVDHLQADKWSFRVKVRGESTLLGMKQFSLHHPKTREYLYEWIFHQALKREGLIGLRYEFIKVTANGTNLGVYALEEHFEKRLIEHNERLEGPIIRFSENLMWEEIVQKTLAFQNGPMPRGSGSYLSSDIDAFQTNWWLSEPRNFQQYSNAIHLLESFRRGDRLTGEVFDVRQFAAYLAIVDLMGTEHGARWHNIRFYYNPVTSRLEPIGFDGNVGPITSIVAEKGGKYLSNPNTIPGTRNNFYAMIFRDPVFFEAYVQALARLSQPSYLDELFLDIRDKLEKNLNILYSEFPYYKFSKEVLYQNQQFIKTMLNPVKGLHAYYPGNFLALAPTDRPLSNALELYLGNIQALPLEVLHVSYGEDTEFPTDGRIILPAKIPTNLVDYRRVAFAFPKDFAETDLHLSDLKVHYRVLGTSERRIEHVFPWTYLDDGFFQNDFLRQPSNVGLFEFFAIDESAKNIFITPGKWTVDQSVIIPKGYTLIAREGVHLNLTNSAKMISYSPLEWIGTEDRPIVIESTDSKGQGLLVLNANRTSVLEHVIFRNLSNPSHQGWGVTGAVTFYESPVEISHCEFANSRSEDALNIVRTEFIVRDSRFTFSSFDALDADFTRGQIINSFFAESGNDAIDVSGSIVELEDILIRAAGDKGLSVGENSKLTVSQIDIKDAVISVASKDLSEVSIDTITISDSKIGFAAYQKKPEFGPATIEVKEVEIFSTAIPYLIEKRSRMRVDGTLIKGSQQNVEKNLYEMGTAK